MYWRDYTVIGCNGSDLTNAPFMPDDHIKGDKLKAYNARAIKWMQEHCRPIWGFTEDDDGNPIGDKIIVGYDKTIIEFPGFDPMIVSNAEWWSDNFNFAQDLEDNRLFQFLAMFAMSLGARIKLFLQDAAIILLLLLTIALINPNAIRIGGV